MVRGKNYKIVDIHLDDCFTFIEGSRNVIYVDKPFENNVKNQCFRFRTMIWLKARLLSLEASNMLKYRSVHLQFKENNNKNRHGTMELTFSSAVFNSSGFYTRNLAVPEADI